MSKESLTVEGIAYNQYTIDICHPALGEKYKRCNTIPHLKKINLTTESKEYKKAYRSVVKSFKKRRGEQRLLLFFAWLKQHIHGTACR